MVKTQLTSSHRSVAVTRPGAVRVAILSLVSQVCSQVRSHRYAHRYAHSMSVLPLLSSSFDKGLAARADRESIGSEQDIHKPAGYKHSLQTWHAIRASRVDHGSIFPIHTKILHL